MGGLFQALPQVSDAPDVLSRNVHYGWRGSEVNILNKLRVAIGWQRGPRFAMFGGVALNVFVSDEREGTDIAYGLDYATKSGDTTIRLWPGLFMGIEF
jgi:hypothetical protein